MNIMEQAIKALGIEPDQLKAQIVSVVSDFNFLKSELGAGKSGFIAAVNHFDARLTNVETALHRIEEAMGTLPQVEVQPGFQLKAINGGDNAKE